MLKVNDELVYEYMDWAEIEAVVYSEHDNPHSILGPRQVEKGILIQCFFPNAKSVAVVVEKTGKKYETILEDDAGYFATLLPGKRIMSYYYQVEQEDGSIIEVQDPYRYDPVINLNDIKSFKSGTHYTIYEKLGAHIIEIKGTMGTHFAVWAPGALRVSVVGDFNDWDGRIHQMRRLKDSGIFELFIPKELEGSLYKYEIKKNGDITFLKSDPYGVSCELRPDTASIVCKLDKHQWKDEKWLEERERAVSNGPMSIYEVHLGSWKKPKVTSIDEEGKEILIDDKGGFISYRELAPQLASYVKEMNYTHIELMPIMEHPLDESWGYQVTGYYAVTSRFGTPEDFMYFIDYMHKEKIGVILDWVPAHFPKDSFGLANFDGTPLYEHPDPRRGEHPHWGTLIFDYGKPEVSNFLIANALFWAEKYHIDGIRMDAVASMLYLDYGKQDSEWLPNIFGGNENLEVVELLKRLNIEMKKSFKGVLMIAEESTSWPRVTETVSKDGLGFDYKWNMGWMNDFLEYIKCDPLFRKGRHNLLTFSMVYQYSEKFMLILSHDEVTHGKGSMIRKMHGDYQQKFDNLRVAYGFMMVHPGKKLLFMGQDFAQFDEWNEKAGLQWELIEKYQSHRQLNRYVKALNCLYKDYPALYELDDNINGFEWVNCMDAERSVISFLRKTNKKEETLLIVCNFTPVVYENFKVGVPFIGKYKETFNSDCEEFGGKGNINSRMKQSKGEEWDEREHSISITVPPLGIAVFTCTPTKNIDKKITNQTVAKNKKTKTVTGSKTTVTKKVVTKKKAEE